MLSTLLLTSGCAALPGGGGNRQGATAGTDARNTTKQPTDTDEKRAYLGAAFEPDLAKTDFFDACVNIPEDLLARYRLQTATGEFAAPRRNPEAGTSVCHFDYMGDQGPIGSVTMMSTLQPNDVRAQWAEELFDYHFEKLPDARVFYVPRFEMPDCEVSIDTERGRIAVGGATILGEPPNRDAQCHRNAEILYELVAISKGDRG